MSVPNRQPNTKNQGRGGSRSNSQPRRARAQGQETMLPQRKDQSQGLNRYTTLPDLRFLNHNNPAPTASSLLDPTSTNSMNEQQAQALKEAEAWYAGTVTLLKERLVLAERLREGLGEVNRLLIGIEDARESVDADEPGAGVDVVGKGMWADVVGQQVQDKDAGGGLEGDEQAVTSDNSQSKAKGVVGEDPGNDAGDSSAAAGRLPSTGDDLKLMEDAIEMWLKDIRISRAKWIAGGRDMERRIGLR